MKKLVLSLWVVICGVFAKGDSTDMVNFEKVSAGLFLNQVCKTVKEICDFQENMRKDYKPHFCDGKELSGNPENIFIEIGSITNRVRGFKEFYAKIASVLDSETVSELDRFQSESANALKNLYGEKVNEFNQFCFRIAGKYFEDPEKATRLKFLQENCLKIIKFFCKHLKGKNLFIADFSKLKQLKDCLNVLLTCVLYEKDVDVDIDILHTIFTVEDVDPNFRDRLGFCPLGLAISLGNKEIVRKLMQQGADPNRENIEDIFSEDQPTLIEAAVEEGNPEIVQELLPCVSDPNLNKALMCAVEEDNLEIVQMLLPYVSKSNPNLDKALMCAIRNGFVGIMEKLIEWKADITTHDEKGYSCLFLSIMSGNLEAVQAVLQHDIDINEQDSLGRTPLFCATESKNIPIAQELLGRGADVNKTCQWVGPDKTNYTNAIALNIAIAYENLEIVQMLLGAHSEVDHCCTITVKAGTKEKTIEATSINIAVQKGNIALVKMLLDAGAREVKPFSADVVRKNKSCIKILIEEGISPSKIPAECFYEDFIYRFIKTVGRLEGEPSYEETVEAFKECSGLVILPPAHAKKLKEFCHKYGKKSEKSVVPISSDETSKIAIVSEESKNTAFEFVTGDQELTNTQRVKGKKAQAAQRKSQAGEATEKKSPSKESGRKVKKSRK